MDFFYWFKLLLTISVATVGANWFFNILYINRKKDFTSVAHNQQANVASVRKQNETAYYRNFLVPLGFPLITGLSLSLKYKIRNGNFGDVWKAIMELSKDNTITFSDDTKKYTLGEINGMATHVLDANRLKDYKSVGIAVPQSTQSGFVMSLVAMVGSIKYSLKPHFLASIPRQRVDDMDVLVIDSWKSYQRLSGSEKWYKLIIVCGDITDETILPPNVKAWNKIIKGYSETESFDYVPPEDNSDDSKVFAFTTSAWNATTSFTQGCLVSGIASFVQGFPSGHELSAADSLLIAGELGKADLSIHFWHKALAVLLHGGSISFVDKTTSLLKKLNGITLLFCEPQFLAKLLDEVNFPRATILQRFKLAWATTLLSEGVFSTSGQSSLTSLDRLRCVFISVHIENTQLVSSFPKKIPKRQSTLNSLSRKLLVSENLNRIRAQLGARVVVELYCPFVVMGPLFQTNFYDYRVLPKSVDSNFLCCGAISTNLEGKLVRTEENSDLDIEKRQGMLCIRGFTIGKPVDNHRLEAAMNLSGKFGGGEGWMPMVGIFGLFGKDGCLYIYE